MKTLEEILNYEKEHRHEDGIYGIKACKERIKGTIEMNKKMNKQFNTTKYPTSLDALLESYVDRANESSFFNDAMVLACWELINNK